MKEKYPGLEIEYEKRIARGYHLSIAIYPNNRVIVRVPKSLKKTGLNEFLVERKEWVREKFQWNLKNNPTALQFMEGETIPIFGSQKTITWSMAKESNLTKTSLHIPSKKDHKPTTRIRLGKAILKSILEEKLGEIIPKYSKNVPKKIKKVRIRTMRSLWGTCSHDNSLSFNLSLVFCPENVIHAVVAHEIAHLVHLNHSMAFWNLLESWFPEYEKADLWMKKNGPQMLCYLL